MLPKSCVAIIKCVDEGEKPSGKHWDKLEEFKGLSRKTSVGLAMAMDGEERR